MKGAFEGIYCNRPNAVGKRSWMWTMVFVTACNAISLILFLVRHEPWDVLIMATVVVIISGVLALSWRRETDAAKWMVFGNGVELEAKNMAQAQMIAGYISMIHAAKEAGVAFWWEGGAAKAGLYGEPNNLQSEKPPFSKGAPVYVENHQFTGYGLAQHDTAAEKRVVSVLIENGNTWNYDVNTVRNATPEEFEKMPRYIRERARG
jgi:Na+/proline symporter